MIDFNEKMKIVVNNVDGAIACVFAGLDGIGVANIVSQERFDSSVLDVELANMMRSFMKLSENLELAKANELSLKAGDVTFFLKLIGEEYFLGIVLGNNANLGRARVELKKIIPEFEKELYT